MQKYFDKIKERLEEETYCPNCSMYCADANMCGFDEMRKQAIEIVNQVAEEYKSTDDGWIPCSERIPIGEEYELYDAEDDITYHKHVWVHTKDGNVPHCVAYYDTDTWFCAVSNEPLSVDAWKPIAPYQPKGE